MDRKEAVETLALMMSGYSHIRKNEMEWEALSLAIEALQQPQVGSWIPVSERLPEDRCRVLVTVNGKHDNIIFLVALETAEHDGDFGWIVKGHPKWTDPNVTAWMPLPECWKGENNG